MVVSPLEPFNKISKEMTKNHKHYIFARQNKQLLISFINGFRHLNCIFYRPNTIYLYGIWDTANIERLQTETGEDATKYRGIVQTVLTSKL